MCGVVRVVCDVVGGPAKSLRGRPAFFRQTLKTKVAWLPKPRPPRSPRRLQPRDTGRCAREAGEGMQLCGGARAGRGGKRGSEKGETKEGGMHGFLRRGALVESAQACTHPHATPTIQAVCPKEKGQRPWVGCAFGVVGKTKQRGNCSKQPGSP